MNEVGQDKHTKANPNGFSEVQPQKGGRSQSLPSPDVLSPSTSKLPTQRPSSSSSSSSDHRILPPTPSNNPDATTVPAHTNNLRTLAEMRDLAESDCFVQLVEKEKLRTKDGKPYFKLTFRDRKRSVQSLFWFDSQFFLECEKNWKVGEFFKIRGSMRDSGYGPKLEVRRIRKVVPEDENDGFNPRECQPSSEQPPEEIIAILLAIADKQIGKGPLLNLVRRFFKEYRLPLSDAAASRMHHRTYVGGLLEHTLSVTRLAIMTYDHFCIEFPQLTNRVSKPLLVAGALLHDAGKILDSSATVTGVQKTLAGNLINHQILGVGLIQRLAAESRLDDETTYQLEHLILTHSRFPEWGSPSPPQTLEAMLLHYADYADSTFVSSMKILEEDVTPDKFSQRKGPFGVPIMKPLQKTNSGPKPVVCDGLPENKRQNLPPEATRKLSATTSTHKSPSILGSDVQET